MNSDLSALPEDRVPRSRIMTTAWALIMAGLFGCAADVPQGSAGSPRYELAVPRREFRVDGEKFYDVRFHPDGRHLATMGGEAAKESRLRIWEIATGSQVVVSEPTVAIRTGRMAFSPDGTTLAAGDSTGSVRLWNAETGRERLALPGHSGAVFQVAFSPDGTILASASNDCSVRLWVALTGRPINTLQGHARQATRVAFSPDGKVLASSSSEFGDNVRIWEVGTGKCLRVLKGHQTQVHALAYRPDGRQLASSSKEGIRLWDPASGAENLFIPLPGDVFDIALAYTPDGSRLISADDGGTGPNLGPRDRHDRPQFPRRPQSNPLACSQPGRPDDRHGRR